jgi:MFS family permease
MPVLDAIRTAPGRILLGTGVTLAPASVGYLFSVYLISYGTTQVGLQQQTLLQMVTVAAAIYLASAYVTGQVGDRVGPRRIFFVAMGLSLVAPFVCFPLFETGTVAGALACLVVLGVLLGLMVSVQAIIVSSAFDANLRYTGASLAYQLGAVLGGLTPLIATALFASIGSSQVVAAYIAGLVVVSAACIALLPHGTPTAGAVPDPAVPRPM